MNVHQLRQQLEEADQSFTIVHVDTNGNTTEIEDFRPTIIQTPDGEQFGYAIGPDRPEPTNTDDMGDWLRAKGHNI